MNAAVEAAPRPGDRFVHAHYLRVDARPPYGDDSYEIREVTAVRQGRVYHRPACITGPADRWFAVTDIAGHVREWLTGQLAGPHTCLEPHTACPHLSHRFE